MRDLELEPFFRGTLAVLAYRGKTRLQLVPGIADVALAKTMDLLAKQLERERLRPRFRITGTKPSSALQSIVKAMQREGLIGQEGDLTPLTWHPQDALAWLSETELSLALLERSGKLFWGQHETARIRASLHALATRPKTYKNEKA